MIISCPHCQTKYQVTYDAIGSAGRKVQCAHCQQAWDQGPIDKDEPPPEIRKAEQAIAEDGLDDAMSAEEKAANAKSGKAEKEKAAKAAKAAKAEKDKAAKAAKLEKQRAAKEAKTKKISAKDEEARGQAAAGKIDPSVIRKRRKAFSRPDEKFMDDVPLARLRLALRIVGGTALVAVLAYAYVGRVQVVQAVPAMAGVYDAVGLGINVVGLDFSDVSALQTLRNGKDVLIVSAQIVGMSPNPVQVPAVVVTLIGPNGQGVYQWSVQPSVRDLMMGERSTFDTQLTLPPGESSRVRLSFAGGSGFNAGKTHAVAAPHAAAAADHSAPAGEHGATSSVPAADAFHGAPTHPAAETAAQSEHGVDPHAADSHGEAAPAADAADAHASPEAH